MISVIIPIYNLENYCRNSIESVLRQSYQDFELLLVDDGSKDGSLVICQEYAKQDSRVRVIPQENAGVSAARNHGIKEARGEYIAFVDGDDILAQNSLETLLSEVNDECPWVLAGHQRISSYDTPLAEAGKNESKIIDSKTALQRVLTGHFPISVCGGIFLKHALDGVAFPDGYRNNEDKFFIYNFLLKNLDGNVKILSDKLYGYYVRENSASTSQWNGRLDAVELAKKIQEITEEQLPEFTEYAKRNLVGTLFQTLRSILRAGKLNEENQKIAQKIRQEILAIGMLTSYSKSTRLEYICLKTGLVFYKLLVKVFDLVNTKEMSYRRNERMVGQ